MWASLSAWLLSVLCVGLLVHQYHLSENMHLRATIVQLQNENQQLQNENQHLRDGSTWNKVVFCVTTANGITSIVAGVASGAFSPTSMYQAAINIFYQVFGIDSSTSIPMIGFEKDLVGKTGI